MFGIYNKQGQKLAEITTGQDGAASYTLPKGEFYLKELAAPVGYLLTDELIPFAIETQGQVVESGLTDRVLDDPQHPYTQLLVSSVRLADGRLPSDAAAWVRVPQSSK